MRMGCVLGLGLAVVFGGCGGGGGGSTPPAPAATFRAAPGGGVNAVGAVPTALAEADVNHDGVVDLLVGNHLGDSVSILLGVGDGSFVAGPPVALPMGSGVFDMRVARFDAGPTIDMVVANSFTNTASVYFGIGDGSFSAGPTLTVGGGIDAMGVATGDFDDNGAIDVAVVARSPGLVAVFLNDGSGAFVPADPAGFAVGFEARNVVAGHFNADQVLDLAVSVRNGEVVELHLGVGDGTFVAAPTSPSPTAGQPWDIAAADFNGDGALDVATGGEDSGTVTLLYGNGAGALVPSAAGGIGAGDAPVGVGVGDLSGDGIADLVVANLNDGTLSVLLSNGVDTLVPGPQPVITVGPIPFATVVADLDGDGLLDVAVANQGDDTVHVLLGNAR